MNAAVGIHHAGLLRQHRLGIDGRHAEEGNDPHPEDRTGAADEDRTAGAHDITGAYLCGNCSRQSLKGGEATLLLSAAEIDVAEYTAHSFAKATHLHKAGANGEVKSRADEQDDENIV